MKKIRRGLSVLLASTMALRTMSMGVQAEEKPYEGVTLNVVGVENVISATWKEHFAEFEEATGIKVEFQQFSNEQASQKIAVAMAAG